MPTKEEVTEALDVWQAEAFKLYNLTCVEMEAQNVTFGLPTPIGLEGQHSNGMPSVLSPSETKVTQDSMSWAFSLWMSSGVLPDAQHLSGYVQSMGGGQAASICTLCLMSAAASILALLHSGSDALVSVAYDVMSPPAARPATSLSTSGKTSDKKESTTSSPMTGRWTARTRTLRPLDKRASASGKVSRPKKKPGSGRKRKSSKRKGLSKKKTK